MEKSTDMNKLVISGSKMFGLLLVGLLVIAESNRAEPGVTGDVTVSNDSGEDVSVYMKIGTDYRWLMDVSNGGSNSQQVGNESDAVTDLLATTSTSTNQWHYASKKNVNDLQWNLKPNGHSDHSP